MTPVALAKKTAPGLAAGLTQLSRRLHAPLEAEEDRAMARGWRVERGGWGRRTYRDPRFDALARTVDKGESAPARLGITAVVPAVAR